LENSCDEEVKVRLFVEWYRVHPRPHRLLEALVSNGDPIVPEVLIRLDSSTRDGDRSALLEVLALLASTSVHSEDWGQRVQVTAKRAVDEMTDPYHKELGLRYLGVIQAAP
jgi:hypothetical protein